MEAQTQVQLSDVANQHAQEAGYTRWLETMLAGWQKWYEDMRRDYAPVSGAQQ